MSFDLIDKLHHDSQESGELSLVTQASRILGAETCTDRQAPAWRSPSHRPRLAASPTILPRGPRQPGRLAVAEGDVLKLEGGRRACESNLSRRRPARIDVGANPPCP
jgi:hypothetical protein